MKIFLRKYIAVKQICIFLSIHYFKNCTYNPTPNEQCSKIYMKYRNFRFKGRLKQGKHIHKHTHTHTHTKVLAFNNNYECIDAYLMGQYPPIWSVLAHTQMNTGTIDLDLCLPQHDTSPLRKGSRVGVRSQITEYRYQPPGPYWRIHLNLGWCVVHQACDLVSYIFYIYKSLFRFINLCFGLRPLSLSVSLSACVCVCVCVSLSLPLLHNQHIIYQP